MTRRAENDARGVALLREGVALVPPTVSVAPVVMLMIFKFCVLSTTVIPVIAV